MEARTRVGTTTTAVLLATGLATGLALGLAGCGGDDEAAPGDRPALPTEPPALWNPCDGLDPAVVSEDFATTFTARTGTPAEPLCSFAPTNDGEPAVDVNYQLYPGDLDELLETFGDQVEADRTEVAEPEVAGADEARVVVDVNDATLAVTGFVRNGRLVQVVNALDPSPFEREPVVAAVEAVLADLAAHASGSGLSDDEAGAPGGSPSDAPAD